MNMNKGKFYYTKNWDGSIRISFTDYGVEFFGGGSFEANYDLNRKNTKKLSKILRKSHSGNLRKMITEEFGEYLEKNNFIEFCKSNDIEIKTFTWIDD